MAEEFVPSKKVLTDFNGGEKYKNGDSIQAETINNLVEGLLYENEDVGGGTTVLVGGEAVAEFDADTKVGFTDLFGEGKTLKVEEQTSACEWLGATPLPANGIDNGAFTALMPDGTKKTAAIAYSNWPEVNRIPTYNTNKTIYVYNAVADTDAPNWGQVKVYVDEQVKEIHCISIYSEEVRIFFYLPAEKGVSFSTVDDIYNYLLEKGIIHHGQDDRGLPASGVIFGEDKWYQIAFIVADREGYWGITAVGAEASYNLLHGEQVTDIIM